MHVQLLCNNLYHFFSLLIKLLIQLNARYLVVVLGI